jgi:N utilization substance protein B
LDLDAAIPKFWRQQWTCQMEEAQDQEPADEAEKGKPIEDRVAPPKIRLFAEVRVRGVRAHLADIDERLKSYTQNWPLHRMGSVERNVLRLAFYELLHCPDVPPAVVLNEAIDLAKYFSNADAGRFVNGVLDKLNKDIHGPK